jgi:hypothetical protein
MAVEIDQVGIVSGVVTVRIPCTTNKVKTVWRSTPRHRMLNNCEFEPATVDTVKFGLFLVVLWEVIEIENFVRLSIQGVVVG